MYSFFNDKAVVYRKTVNAEDGKTTESVIDNNILGFLKASSMQDVAQGNGAFGTDHNFTTRGTANIKAGDRIVINEISYAVKSVGLKHSISLRALVCKLSKLNA